MTPLTTQQAAVLAYVIRFMAVHQHPPTRAEIAQAFGWRSPNAAEEFLQRIARKGYISLSGTGKARNIFVLSRPA